jgi:hypothetical protein
MSQSTTMSAYDLAFQVSPIILVNGIAASTPGRMLPIIALTGQLAAFVQGAATGGLSTNDFFARFVPIPGGTFVAQQIGRYPFANQNTAGNAVIRQRNQLSLLMMCPVQDDAGYLTKLPILSALQASLSQHNMLGGTYTIATPGMIYQNGVMLGMTHVDGGETKQQQTKFQLDFWFPLITASQANAAMGNLMQAVHNGTQIVGPPTWSGQSGIGVPPGVSGLPASTASLVEDA